MPHPSGGSPGNGTTLPTLSREPLATEGEATSGPDSVNPYERAERKAEQREQSRPPGPAFEDPPGRVVDDVPVFDDVDDEPSFPSFF